MADDDRFAELKFDERYRQGKHSSFGQKKHHQANKPSQHVEKGAGKYGDSKKGGAAESHKISTKIDKRFVQDAKTFDEDFVPNKYGGLKKNKHAVTKELKEMVGESEDEEEINEDEEEDVEEDASESRDTSEIRSRPKARRDPEAGFEWNAESSDEEIDMEKVNQLLGNDAQDEEDAWTTEESEAPMMEASSKRLALMNYDWNKIHSGDLMITFCSFLPEGGVLKKVSVYPSEFGLKKMAEEELHGPGDIFKPTAEDNGDEEPEETTRASNKKKPKEENALQKHKRQIQEDDWAVSHEDKRNGLDLNKLRKYERDRLKYYYAVLDFDSGKTADAVYEACNGYELEKTGIKIGSM